MVTAMRKFRTGKWEQLWNESIKTADKIKAKHQLRHVCAPTKKRMSMRTSVQMKAIYPRPPRSMYLSVGAYGAWGLHK